MASHAPHQSHKSQERRVFGYTRDEWLDLLPTQGGYTRLPPDRLAELLAGVGAAVDEVGGAFVVRYTTVALAATRAAAAPAPPPAAAPEPPHAAAGA